MQNHSKAGPEAEPEAWPDDSLDPRDWEDFRRLCHAALDESIEYLRTVRDRPVWRPLPDGVRSLPTDAAPFEGGGLAPAYEEFRRRVLPFPTGNIHPRFFGWVHGTGMASGILAEMLAATMNANTGGRDHSAMYVERAVIEWCRGVFGFPESASGLLTTGTSMGTVVALAVARNRMAEGDVRRGGIAGERLTAYASDQVHQAAVKSFELLGLGADALRKVPSSQDFRMDLTQLRAAIARDRAAGLRPFCVIGTAGTVNTGAVDDLPGVARICAEEGLWFHVDGAFGALCAFSGELRGRVAGIELADSLAFDFHKWMFVQYGVGCVLVRDGEAHRDAFAVRESYLHGAPRGLAGGDVWFCDYGPELSRGFLALRVWFALKEHGFRKLGRVIQRNCLQAAYLRGRVSEHPELHLLAGDLNVACFRYEVPGLDGGALDALNAEVVADLQERGIAAPSTTRIRGRLAIRTAITNHRTRKEDLDILLDAVVQLARERLAGASSGSTG